MPDRLGRALVRRYLAHLPSPADAVVSEAAPLELFLRIGPRDLDVVPLAVASLRRHLTNRVRRVVAATPGAQLRAVRGLLPDAEVVPDEELLPVELRRAIEAVAPVGRVSWLAQQFLTLVFVSTRARGACLVWDADTVMTRPQTLLHGDTSALAVSLEHHTPYFVHIGRLLPTLPLPAWSSTVAHHMVMAPDLLGKLLAEIAAPGAGRPWWQAILDHVDSGEPSCMAEYELYGQWVRHRHPDRVRLVAFRNVGLSRRRLSSAGLEALSRSGRLDSVSFHWYHDP